MSNRIIAVIQARMRSTRFYGKCLVRVADRPLIEWILLRLERTGLPVVVSTGDHKANLPILQWALDQAVPIFTGPEADLIVRLQNVLKAFPQAEAIVRITGDCPFVSAPLIRALAEAWIAHPCDYVSNVFPRHTYPDGLDGEILSRTCLDKLDKVADDRESLTTWIWRYPDSFSWQGLMLSPGLVTPPRWTVDYPGDQALPEAVFSRFGAEATLSEILSVYNELKHA